MYNGLMARSKSGFTIVELLIVIVVIAILAAISVVAYTGIQNRAYNTKVIAGSDQYQKAFLAYKAVNGSYPTGGGCLGTNYPNNACWASSSSGASPSHSVVSSLDSALSEFIASKPEVGTDLIDITVGGSTYQYRGGLIYLPGDVTYGYRLTYYLRGRDANCALSSAGGRNEGPLTQCNISLP